MPAIPFLIVAGGQIVSTYLQNKAQNQAADAQTQANAQAQTQERQGQGEALNRITQTQEAQRQLYNPYASLGAGAATTLASRLGLPSMPDGAPGMQPGVAGSPTFSPNTQLTPVDPGNAQGIVSNPNGPPLSDGSATGDPRSRGTLAQIGTAVQRNQAQQQTQSGYVNMAGPDGSTKLVPQNEVNHWISKGARVLQGGA